MRIGVVSFNASTWMVGEAIKAFQFFKWLRAQGYDAYLLTHSRNSAELIDAFGKDRVVFVEDTFLQHMVWRSRVLSFALTAAFHIAAARVVRRFGPEDTVLHYVCPISPIEPRFVPRGYRSVIGPINGNIYHPPGFKQRESRKRRWAEALQRPTQTVMGWLFRDKKRADTVLVSGYTRTRVSLRWAGVADDHMVDVLDSGIEEQILTAEPIQHEGRNARFLSVARLINLKAIDLMIRALAQTDEDATLTVVGEGPERPALEALAHALGVADRVDFKGFVGHDDLMDLSRMHRALLFPSLCEANGIAMQEAMAIGLPVIAINWGGQSALADAQSAVYLDPVDEVTLVQDMARAMSDLAGDPDHATEIAKKARVIAKGRFAWDDVAKSWIAPYADLIGAP